jgi:hypothetical protein
LSPLQIEDVYYAINASGCNELIGWIEAGRCDKTAMDNWWSNKLAIPRIPYARNGIGGRK